MSSPTPALRPHQTTEYGPRADGSASASARSPASASPLAEMAGRQFGRLIVTSAGVTVIKGNKYLPVLCIDCGSSGVRHVGSLRKLTAGCRRCGNPQAAPRWLLKRCEAAFQRCTNPNSTSYERYGGRGIRFEFDSPIAMAVWVQKNLGLDHTLEIDRIDNEQGYRPGNLRLSTPQQNTSHTRKTAIAPLVHAFKFQHPQVRYADSTLSRLFASGSTPQEIVERWARPSCKPKGVYGTCSTPDHFIASLAKA